MWIIHVVSSSSYALCEASPPSRRRAFTSSRAWVRVSQIRSSEIASTVPGITRRSRTLRGSGRSWLHSPRPSVQSYYASPRPAHAHPCSVLRSFIRHSACKSSPSSLIPIAFRSPPRATTCSSYLSTQAWRSCERSCYSPSMKELMGLGSVKSFRRVRKFITE